MKDHWLFFISPKVPHRGIDSPGLPFHGAFRTVSVLQSRTKLLVHKIVPRININIFLNVDMVS